MRFPEEKIKEAILHPDIEIRDRAIIYFAESYSHDPSLMGLVVNAVQTYGRQDAYRLIGRARDLPQTEESIAWVIAELNDEQSARYENYPYNLSMVLLEADPALLVHQEAAVLGARHFLAELRPAFTERLRMLSWDEATCWRKLEECCAAGKDKGAGYQIDLDHARGIVEALARHGAGCEAKVLALLAGEWEYDDEHIGIWMEPMAARLAGEARLESAVGPLVDKLMEDGGDILNEECARALTRIGTPAVLHIVAAVYPGAADHFRIYAINPLEHIHSDLAVEKCLDLLGQEKEEHLRDQLASALLSHFAHEGIEAARQRLVGRKLDLDSRGLRDFLLETCTLTGERFPEYDAWLAESKAEKEEHQRRLKELEGDPKGLMLFALEKLMGDRPAGPPPAPAPSAPPPPPPPRPRPTMPPVAPGKRKAGRNDPCPCGSGKKFKKCCGRS